MLTLRFTSSRGVPRLSAWALACGLVWCLSGLVPGSAARAAEPAPTRSLSADERLDAIRRGLLQAALEGATRVESVAWLDTEGRLHESSSFRSGMQVRGVQVLSYVRDREGQTQARLSLPADAAQAPGSRRDLIKTPLPAKPNGSCEAARNSSLRHLIGLEVSVGGRWSAQDAPLAQVLAGMVGSVWLLGEAPVLQATAFAPPADKRPGVPNWRMVAEGEGVKDALEAPRSAYEQALLGTTTQPLLPWMARLQVLPGPQLPAPEASYWMQKLQALQGVVDLGTPTARISLSLQASGQSRTALTLSADVPLLREPSQWGAPQLSPAGRAQVEALLERWGQALSAQFACEPVLPSILPTANGSLRMNAGTLAGVHAGEEWLLADPQAFPERVLTPGVAQQLVLAKVLRVHARYAELQILAGPARPVQAGWRAWRVESPLGE